MSTGSMQQILNMDIKVGEYFCACHSEELTRRGLKDKKIIFPIVSIEIATTEESLF